MIRLLQRKLIIPRGDTGSFTIPAIAAASASDVAVFTIFDRLTRTKAFQKRIAVDGAQLKVEFNHNETVNLVPGHYVWDIKFYKNPIYADEELINGEEIDSYYAGYSLPECEIRETGDDLLISPDAAQGELTPEQLDIITAAITEASNAKIEAQNKAAEAATSADEADASARSAAEQAENAAQSAAEAAASANSAAASKNDALASATAAAQSATIAGNKAQEAEQSAIRAENAANVAEESADAAENSATNAAESAADAATAKNSAQTSADDASQSAIAARQSADASAQSASEANVSKEQAQAAATNAAASENNANISANTASEKAGEAYMNSLAAERSAVSATASKNAAAQSEAAANTSRNEAQAAATSAAASAAQAQEYAGQLTGLTTEAQTLPAGASATASYDAETGVLTLGLPQGDSFHIVKTYASVAEMNADYNNSNIKIGDFVMITSTVEDPDNAKIYVKGNEAYTFVVDMSGASGIEGVSIAGIQKTSTSGLVDTYTISYTNDTTTTFTVTNGEDGDEYTVLVQANQPTQNTNKLWIPTEQGVVQNIPTVEEVENEFDKVWEQLKENNSVKLCDETQPTNNTSSGITFSWNGNSSCVVTGTPTGNATSFSFARVDSLPNTEFKAGGTYFLHLKVSSKVQVRIIFSKRLEGGSMLDTQYFTADTLFTIPNGYNSFSAVLYVPSTSGYVYENVECGIYTAPSNLNLWDDVDTLLKAKIPTGGSTKQVLTKTSDFDYDAEWQAPSGVTDVQVNGSSVVSQGVANVPYAGPNNAGVVKTSPTYGVYNGASGVLLTNLATSTQTKAGADAYRPIVPYNQHEAAFYGLAKAAGDTTQSQSSNAVGSYTETAKSKISEMLNSPVTVTGTTPTITALSGIQYVCGEVATLDITLPASGIVDVVFQSGSTPTVLTVTPQTGMTVEWAGDFDSTALDADTLYELNIKMVGTKCLGVAGSWT